MTAPAAATGSAPRTKYLLDADVFIRAKRDHYRFGVFPCFWQWIQDAHAAEFVYSVEAIERELLDGADELSTWIACIQPTAFLPPDADTTTSAAIVTQWVSDPARIYSAPAVSDFFASGDYWLISHAHAHGFTLVTHELPAPDSKRRVKIPDVCNALSVPWLNSFEMLQREGATFG